MGFCVSIIDLVSKLLCLHGEWSFPSVPSFLPLFWSHLHALSASRSITWADFIIFDLPI